MYKPNIETRSIICLIQFGLGVETQSKFASKWLVNHLYQFGFSTSYDDVVRYKESVIKHAKDTMLEQQEDQGFVQCVADDVDHNIITFTGQSMGLISIHSSGFICSNSVPRLKEQKKISSILQSKGINILHLFGSSQNGLSKLKFDPILNLQYPTVISSEMYFDLIWNTGWFFQSPDSPRPN